MRLKHKLSLTQKVKFHHQLTSDAFEFIGINKLN